MRVCDREFLEDLALHITRVAYSPKEEIDCTDHLNVLTSGMATRGGQMLGAAAGDMLEEMLRQQKVRWQLDD